MIALKNSWSPVINEKKTIQTITTILKEAKNVIDNSRPTVEKIGFLVGGIGENIFNLYYNAFLQEKDNDTILDNIQYLLGLLSEQEVSDVYIEGFAGLGWGLSFLAQKNTIIQEATADILPQLDTYISGALSHCAKEEKVNIDLFYGLVGYGMYFLERHGDNLSKEKELTLVYNTLHQLKIINGQQIFWDTNREDLEEIDLSAAHGQSMILHFLLRLHLVFPTLVPTEEIKEIANFIIDQNEDNKFPDVIEGDKKVFSPLRWCHGSLMISYIIFQTGTILKDAAIKEIGFQSLLNCTKEKKTEAIDLPHPIICHGTLGLAHIFNRAYQATQDTAFLKATKYWLNEGLLQLKEQGIEFYRKEQGLLFGLEGIGLTLLAAISPENPEWDTAILLS